MNSKVVSDIKTYYGSREWANFLLKLAIKELKNVDRALAARQIEIFYCLDLLERHNYWWQAERLRNHINLAIKTGAIKTGRFTALARADLLKAGRGGDSS